MRVRMRRLGSCVLGCAALSIGIARSQTPPNKLPNGRAVYENWCGPCHDPGIEHPGTHALMSKYPGSPRASGIITEWRDLTPQYIRFMVRRGMSVMPHFRKTEISDSELDALAKYLSRNTPAK
jgi:mono/diheme cytochrome c family protein